MRHHTGAGWRLIHGDAYEVMRSMPTGCVDIVLTDPPFDAHTHETHGHRDRRNGFRSSEAIPFAPLGDVGALASELLRISRGWVLCFCSLEMFGAYQAAAGQNYLRSALWRKPNGIPQFTGDRPAIAAEGIACMFPRSRGIKAAWHGCGKHGIWTHDKPGTPVDRERHPCEKPPELIRELLMDFVAAEPGLTVFDPFAGSAAIGVAAVGLGMDYIGCELDERWVGAACDRLESAAGGGGLFAGVGAAPEMPSLA